MTAETLLLVGITGFIALLAASGILYAAVGMAGGENIEERNSFLTAVFVTILIGCIGLGLRFLLLEDAIARTTACLILVAAWFLIILFSYRLGLIRAFLVLLVQVVLAAMIFFAIHFFNDLLGLYSRLGRIIPPVH